MRLAMFFNAVRISVMVLIGLAVVTNYFAIFINDEDFFESRVLLFLNLIAGLLLLIFLALLK